MEEKKELLDQAVDQCNCWGQGTSNLLCGYNGE